MKAIMKKLQIILMGDEWDRLIYPIKKYKPNKVIFLCQSELEFPEESKKVIDIANNLVKKIDLLVECEIQKVKTHYFAEGIDVLLKIMRGHKDYEEVVINISAGNKIMVAASILISQYFGCKLSYVVPKEYGGAKSDFYAKGALREVKIPTLNILKLIEPKKKEKEIFLYITEEPITLTELITAYSKKKITDVNKSRTLKSLFLYHLKKLVNKNLIEMDNSGKNTKIWLTETGKFIKEVMQ
ncbi:hypothetical protein HY643_03190 [Candidatus Woesearchaeota archaeon]|nr:hypothetical protein [Candidatus Woesearchaeota archaeon]